MREYLMPIFVISAMALAGCNNSKSPEDVSKDVAKAEQKANNEVSKSEERAQNALDKSYEKVNEQEIKFNSTSVVPQAPLPLGTPPAQGRHPTWNKLLLKQPLEDIAVPPHVIRLVYDGLCRAQDRDCHWNGVKLAGFWRPSKITRS